MSRSVIIKSIRNLLASLGMEYDLLEGKRFRKLYLVGCFAFAFLFLLVFEPFGLYYLDVKLKLITIGLYTFSGLVLLYLQFFVFQKIVIKRYTLINTILWLALSFILIGISSSIIFFHLFNEGEYNLSFFLMLQAHVLLVNILPTVILILIHYNITLRKRLKKSSDITKSLKNFDVKDVMTEHSVILNSDNKNEGMSIDLNSFIYVKPVDNYIEVHYEEEGLGKKVLLRYSLSRFEKDNIEQSEILRCHKSYIINKRKVEVVHGNAAGYKLKLYGSSELIPVSRKLNGNLKQILNVAQNFSG